MGLYIHTLLAATYKNCLHQAQIPIPIARRFLEAILRLLAVIVGQAILLAPVHSFSTPSQGFPQ